MANPAVEAAACARRRWALRRRAAAAGAGAHDAPALRDELAPAVLPVVAAPRVRRAEDCAKGERAPASVKFTVIMRARRETHKQGAVLCLARAFPAFAAVMALVPCKQRRHGRSSVESHGAPCGEWESLVRGDTAAHARQFPGCRSLLRAARGRRGDAARMSAPFTLHRDLSTSPGMTSGGIGLTARPLPLPLPPLSISGGLRTQEVGNIGVGGGG